MHQEGVTLRHAGAGMGLGQLDAGLGLHPLLGDRARCPGQKNEEVGARAARNLCAHKVRTEPLLTHKAPSSRAWLPSWSSAALPAWPLQAVLGQLEVSCSPARTDPVPSPGTAAPSLTLLALAIHP